MPVPSKPSQFGNCRRGSAPIWILESSLPASAVLRGCRSASCTRCSSEDESPVRSHMPDCPRVGPLGGTQSWAPAEAAPRADRGWTLPSAAVSKGEGAAEIAEWIGLGPPAPGAFSGSGGRWRSMKSAKLSPCSGGTNGRQLAGKPLKLGAPGTGPCRSAKVLVGSCGCCPSGKSVPHARHVLNGPFGARSAPPCEPPTHPSGYPCFHVRDPFSPHPPSTHSCFNVRDPVIGQDRLSSLHPMRSQRRVASSKCKGHHNGA